MLALETKLGGEVMGRIIRIGFVVGLGAFLVACATQPLPTASDLPGFLLGLWHGAIAPFAFVGGLFPEEFPGVRMYAFPNDGSWYDFGFLIGIGAVWGGFAAEM
jgi:hypothetical protein|tara:strand:+ start:1834 stop:2145 length:312 start_codon:yes stop_codon:yes gene_type:complete